MRILVVGGGGREHALCWAISASPLCTKLFCAPGNAGIAQVAECHDVGAEDIPGQVALARKLKIDFVVIAPDAPLVAGMADSFAAAGIKHFGPSKKAAQLEGSKGFTKELCKRHNIPTAAYERFDDVAKAEAYVKTQTPPIVVKADGLAAGKGVIISEAWDELTKFAEALSIPVATSLGGKGAIDEASDLAMGTIGRNSRKIGNDSVRACDTVLAIGTRLGGLATHRWTLPFNEKTLYHFDADPHILGHNYRTAIGVAGDAKATLALAEQVERDGGHALAIYREPVGDHHESGRSVHRPVRRDGGRPAARAEAAWHPGHRKLQGALVPYEPLGL